MPQHDYVIDNAGGAAVRADLNAALLAIATANSGTAAPAALFPHMRYADTTAGVVRRRNAANSAWIDVESTDNDGYIFRASNIMLLRADRDKTIHATATFAQTFDAPATLGNGWWVRFIVPHTVAITVLGTLVRGPAEFTVHCDGGSMRFVPADRAPLVTSGSMDDLTQSGLRDVSDAVTGKPVADWSHVLIQTGHSDLWAAQWNLAYHTDLLHFRRAIDDATARVWQPWVEVATYAPGRIIPSSATAGTAQAADRGRCIVATAGVTIPSGVYVDGDSLAVYNNSAASIAVMQGAGLTLRLAGTASTGNRALAQRGMATLWFRSPTEAIITGAGLT